MEPQPQLHVLPSKDRGDHPLHLDRLAHPNPLQLQTVAGNPFPYGQCDRQIFQSSIDHKKGGSASGNISTADCDQI